MAAAVNAAADDVGFKPAFDLEAIESRVERSLARKVRQLTDDYPERSLEVIRGWMAER